ncbi:hypothetical protein KAI87_12660 [Myxococcota bacterium]|nr:hypothetical protein [Myxococcota bacterium]
MADPIGLKAQGPDLANLFEQARQLGSEENVAAPIAREKQHSERVEGGVVNAEAKVADQHTHNLKIAHLANPEAFGHSADGAHKVVVKASDPSTDLKKDPDNTARKSQLSQGVGLGRAPAHNHRARKAAQAKIEKAYDNAVANVEEKFMPASGAINGKSSGVAARPASPAEAAASTVRSTEIAEKMAAAGAATATGALTGAMAGAAAAKAPVAQAPVAQAPVAQAPVAQAPAAKTPAAQAPVQAPAAKAPATQAPIAQAPAAKPQPALDVLDTNGEVYTNDNTSVGFKAGESFFEKAQNERIEKFAKGAEGKAGEAEWNTSNLPKDQEMTHTHILPKTKK